MYVKMMGHYPPGYLEGQSPVPAVPFRIFQAVQDVSITHAHDLDPVTKNTILIPDEYKLEVTYEDGVRIAMDVTGTVYILNDQGKTIETFHAGPMPALSPFRAKKPTPVPERQVTPVPALLPNPVPGDVLPGPA